MVIKRFVVVAIFAAAAVLVDPAGSAVASAPPTVCDSRHSPTGVVDGDVVVPNEGLCNLVDVTVHGTVTSDSETFVTLGSNVHVDGDVTGGLHAYLYLLGATVDGDVLLNYVNSLAIDDSTVGGSVKGTYKKILDVPECDFGVSNSTIRGDFDITATGIFREVCAYHDVVGRDLRITDAALNMKGASVGGNVVLTGSHSFRNIKFVRNGWVRAFICSFDVAGDLTLQGSFSSIALGGSKCYPGRLDVHGSLMINANLGQVVVSAHVHGDVICRDNAHDPIASHPNSRHLQNIVDGQLVGQCATLAVRGS